MSNAINVPTPIYIDPKDEWVVFDSLPFCVRAMMAIAPFEYSAVDIKPAYDSFRRGADPFGLGKVDPREFAYQMDMSFKQDVKSNSTTGAEKNGSFNLVRQVHAKQSKQRDFRSLRIDRTGRHGGIFPPIKTFRGTETNHC